MKKMLNHKYRWMFTLCLAGLWLSIFSPKRMRDYYPSAFSVGKKVKYYCFSKHYWLQGKP